jgi:hypothetical protein
MYQVEDYHYYLEPISEKHTQTIKHSLNPWYSMKTFWVSSKQI